MSAIDIPGYKIIKTLGVGGQATVYLAIQKGFDREVALKVMSPALAADPTFGDRFLREAKIVSKLSHSRIVTVYDVGEAGSFYYLSMEYMRGEELKNRIANGLKAKEALIIVAKLGQALHFAHKKGYVHRDVKSENILFNDDDQPVLTDFGIAKASNSSTQMTQTGKLIGTPEYMSPEQCRGRKLDGRSDLYSLGIILFEMLTRDVPYRGDDSVSVCLQHVTKPVPKLPARLNHLQWLIDSLLAKKTSGRFQTGQELAIAIKEFLKTGRHINTVTETKPEKKQEELEPLIGRKDDFENDDISLNDNFEIEQRISHAPEVKSRVPLTAFSIILIIVCVLGYLLREQWMPQAKQYLAQFGEKKPQNLISTESEKLKIERPLNSKNRNAKENRKDATIPVKDSLDAERAHQLIQQADTLAQYSPHELTDVKLALEHLITARSLEPGNTGIKNIKQSLISIALEEAIQSAQFDKFDSAEDWLKLVDSADKDNNNLQTTRREVARLESSYAANTALRKESTKQIESLLERAELAMRENRLGTPDKNNAIYFYESILKAQPDNEIALSGMKSVGEKYEQLINRSIVDNQFSKARRYLRNLKRISDREDKIFYAALENQINQSKEKFDIQMQEKRRIAEIKKENQRKEQERKTRISNPLVQMQILSSLEAANSLYRQGNLVEPIGNNALEKFRATLDIDNRDETAIEGIGKIEKTILDNLDVALSNQIKNTAEKWLAKLKLFDPEYSKLPEYQLKFDEIVIEQDVLINDLPKTETIESENLDGESSQEPIVELNYQ